MTKDFTLRIKKELDFQVENLASEIGVSKKAVILFAIHYYLKGIK